MRNLWTATTYFSSTLHGTSIKIFPMENIQFKCTQLCIWGDKLLSEICIIFAAPFVNVTSLRALAVLFDWIRQVRMMRQIFIILLLILLQLNKMLLPLAPSLMLVSTATTVNFKFRSLHCINSGPECLFWSASLNDVFIEMSRKFPADIIQDRSKSIDCDNDRDTNSFENLSNHFWMTSWDKDHLYSMLVVFPYQTTQPFLVESVQYAKSFIFLKCQVVF